MSGPTKDSAFFVPVGWGGGVGAKLKGQCHENFVNHFFLLKRFDLGPI